MEPDIVLARATVHLSDGIAPGRNYWVDRNEEYVADALTSGALVLVVVDDAPAEQETEPESEPEPIGEVKPLGAVVLETHPVPPTSEVYVQYPLGDGPVADVDA